MSKSSKPKIGAITWTDLTVKPARKVRDFYAAVVGWKSSEVQMGGYSDFCMNQPADGRTVAGICHARGENAALPAQWLIYINVANLKRSLAACRRRGGKVMCPQREMAGGKMAVIRDPGGASGGFVRAGAELKSMFEEDYFRCCRSAAP
jgi:predicted enzyme related to lactoylglutathione lyase